MARATGARAGSVCALAGWQAAELIASRREELDALCRRLAERAGG